MHGWSRRGGTHAPSSASVQWARRGEVMPSRPIPTRSVPRRPGTATRQDGGRGAVGRSIARPRIASHYWWDCEMSQILVCFWSLDLLRSNQANPFPPPSVFPSSPSSAHTPHTCPCFHRALSSWTTDATAVPVACASLLFYSCSFFYHREG